MRTRCGSLRPPFGVFSQLTGSWIETMFGHIKSEWPHLNNIADPDVLETELERVRIDVLDSATHTSSCVCG